MKLITHFGRIILLNLILSTINLPLYGQTFGFKVKVSEREGNTPATGVKVRIPQLNTEKFTDSNGEVTFNVDKKYDGKQFMFEVSNRVGYVLEREELLIRASNPPQLRYITLTMNANTSISGYVYENTTEEKEIEGVSVTLHLNDSKEDKKSKTDENGYFIFENISFKTTYTLIFKKNGFKTQNKNYNRGDNTENKFYLELDSKGSGGSIDEEKKN